MAKTLQQLVMDELGSDDQDKADALADVVLDWVGRIERNDEVALADGWRERIEDVRRYENKDGNGR